MWNCGMVHFRQTIPKAKMSATPPSPTQGTPNPIVTYGYMTCQLAQQTFKHDWFEENTSITATCQFFSVIQAQYNPHTLRWRMVNPGIADITNWLDVSASINLAIENGLPATLVSIPGYPLQNQRGAPEQREILFEITDATLPGNVFYSRKVFTVFRPDFLNDLDS